MFSEHLLGAAPARGPGRQQGTALESLPIYTELVLQDVNQSSGAENEFHLVEIQQTREKGGKLQATADAQEGVSQALFCREGIPAGVKAHNEMGQAGYA